MARQVCYNTNRWCKEKAWAAVCRIECSATLDSAASSPYFSMPDRRIGAIPDDFGIQEEK